MFVLSHIRHAMEEAKNRKHTSVFFTLVQFEYYWAHWLQDDRKMREKYHCSEQQKWNDSLKTFSIQPNAMSFIMKLGETNVDLGQERWEA